MSQPDLRGFKLVNGKVVTTLPKWTDLGPEQQPFHPADDYPDEPIGSRNDDGADE
jgi:hypothetical protein